MRGVSYRSMLCTPATAEDRYLNCHRSGADICLVDLEDSVPAARKEEARGKAASFFTGPAAATLRCAIRINAITEQHGLRDLLALRDYPVTPGIILVPKVESSRDLEIVTGALSPDLELFAIIETPRGLANAAEIAASSTRLRGLIFGSADYSMALGIGLGWQPLSFARAQLVNSARAANIEAIDSPLFDLTDLGLLRQEAEAAGSLGFSGKIALHPDQVPVINQAFGADATELDRAAAYRATG